MEGEGPGVLHWIVVIPTWAVHTARPSVYLEAGGRGGGGGEGVHQRDAHNFGVTKALGGHWLQTMQHAHG